MDEKKLEAISAVQRALGIIEGVSMALPEGARLMAQTATEMIDEAMEVLT